MRKRKATERTAAQASDGSLKAINAVNRISASLRFEFSSLFNIQPLFSSHEQASFADETGLGAARPWASRLTRGVKLRAFCDDVVFWLKLAPREIDRGPLFCLEVSPIATALAERGQVVKVVGTGVGWGG